MTVALIAYFARLSSPSFSHPGVWRSSGYLLPLVTLHLLLICPCSTLAQVGSHEPFARRPTVVCLSSCAYGVQKGPFWAPRHFLLKGPTDSHCLPQADFPAGKVPGYCSILLVTLCANGSYGVIFIFIF